MRNTLESFLPKIKESLEIASRESEWLQAAVVDASTEKVEKYAKVRGERATVAISHARYVPIPQRSATLYEESQDPHYMERHHVTRAFKTLLDEIEKERVAVGSGAVLVVRALVDDLVEADKKTLVVTDPHSGISFSIRDYGTQPPERCRYTVDIAYGVA